MPRKPSARKATTNTVEPSPEKPNAPEPTPAEDAPAATSRPRRAARKSVLYNNQDYEVQIPGQNKHEQPPELETQPAPRITRAKASNSEVAFPEAKETSTPQKKRTFEPDMLKGSKRRKIPAHLAEMMDERNDNKQGTTSDATQKDAQYDESLFAEGSNLVVAAEYEVPHNDDGPPVLVPPVDFDNDDDQYAASGDDSDEEAPSLEKNQLTKRRGRPRRVGPYQRPTEKVESDAPAAPVKIKLPRPSTRIMHVAIGEKTSKSAAHANQKNVKLFESELETTPNGEPYAIVVNGCLAELLRKERIIDLLTNPDEVEMIRSAGWMLDRQPRLPPLTTEKVCYAFYIDGSKVISPKDLSMDDLRPWSATVETSRSNFLNIKPNVRRHPVARQDGKLTVVKVDPRLAELHLTEYTARLPRDLRLRKKIFYLSRDTHLYGNVLILYDYTAAGNIPAIVSLPHGNDLLRNVAGRGVGDGDEDETPFERDIIEGARGGFYLKLRTTKLGWMHNKKHLLDFLYNKQEILRDDNVLNHRLPDLPPLIDTVGVFAYFVPATSITNQIHHASDGLSPWTTNPNNDGQTARVRSTRRPLYEDSFGALSLAPDSQSRTEWSLVETMSTLARCKRIRKRVFYVQRQSGSIHGYVAYFYEFLCEGPLPELFTQSDLKQYQADPKWNPDDPQNKKMDMEPELLNNTPYAPLEMDVMDDEEIIDNGMLDVHDPNVSMIHQPDELQPDQMQMEMIEPQLEDILNNGFDDEFHEDPTDKLDNPEPFYDMPRELESGLVYLTVRHKKMATSFDAVLEYIVNSNIVEERGILNSVKPGHPPIVTNARAYAFFVAGSAIFPHDINRDDFSPWSHNGNAENPTCYRTKVRKFGVVCETGATHFQLRDSDYKTCPFHLVYLYSINPREPRLRKKIYYLMETQSKMVVSHALIIYDYNSEGSLPRLNTGQLKNFQKRSYRSSQAVQHDIYNDVSDLSEGEKDSPFLEPVEVMPDGSYYLQVSDSEFWNDRNRQINFLANHPLLIDQLECLNNKVPEMPPPCTGKGTYAFFVNGEEVGFRGLTTDKLVPWSENVCTNPMGVTKRPKSSKTPLGFNRQNQLRVWKSNSVSTDQVEYLLHVYTATLPRCTRLRKKVVHVQKDGRQFGHALIMYNYTEPGDMPEPIMKHLTVDQYITQIPVETRNHIMELQKTNEPSVVTKIILHEHGIHVHPDVIIAMQQRSSPIVDSESQVVETMWTNADGAGPSTSTAKDVVEEGDEAVNDTMIAGEEMVVEQTVVIDQMNQQYVETMVPAINPFLNKNVSASGFVRGSQRYEALWRIAQKHFGTSNISDTFDQMFKLLHEKNEARLLTSINTFFNVDIYPADSLDHMIVHGAGNYIAIQQQDPNMHHDQMIHQGPIIQEDPSILQHPNMHQDSNICQDSIIHDDPIIYQDSIMHQDPMIHQEDGNDQNFQ